MSTMKAVRMYALGGPEVLQFEDAPRPIAGPGEALVRVHAAGVNPADWKTRAGFQPTRAPLAFPHILGWDVSGVVEAVGENVTAVRAGDPVYGLIRFPLPGSAYAEYVSAPVEHLAPVPANLAHTDIGALPLAALTAWQALFDTAHLQAGQTVVIHGASGGVGHLAVQLAKAQGAQIFAVTSARHANFVRALGADHVIDYQTADLEQSASEVDVVFDTVGGPNGPRLLHTMRRGGVYVSIAWALPAPDAAAASGVTAQGMLVHPDATTLKTIATWVEAGKVTPVIDRIFPLAQAAQAHTFGEEGHLQGKLVLDCLT